MGGVSSLWTLPWERLGLWAVHQNASPPPAGHAPAGGREKDVGL